MAFVAADEDTFQLKLFWVSVLRRAVFDYVLYKGIGSHRREWQNAYRFIFTDVVAHHEDMGLSFEDICYTMGWEPDYIRRLTLEMTRADIKKMEVNGFKEVLSFQEKLAMVADNNSRWEGSRFAIPKFPPYNFPPELRKCFELKPVYQTYERTPPSLEVKWQGGAVA